MRRKTLRLWLGAALFAFCATSAHAITIAVLDAGGVADGSGATFEDLSTGGDTIGAMTGTFVADPADWAQSGPGDIRWNDSEFDYDAASSNMATWTFGGLPVGSEWNVLASWGNAGQANLSTEAPYVFNGTTNLVNQEAGANPDLVLADSRPENVEFQILGTATIGAGGTLVVTLGSDPNGTPGDTDWVIADAIAIMPVSAPSAPEWNEDPVIGDDATVSLAYDSTIAGKASDPNFDPVTYSKVSGPSWLTVNSDGTMTGLAPATTGTNTWIVNASDGTLSANAELKIYVKGLTPPTWTEPVEGEEAVIGVPYSDTLAGQATEPDGDEITYTKVSGPSWLFVGSDGELMGSPAAPLGTNTWVVKATDPQGSADATLSIFIRESLPPEWTTNNITASSGAVGEDYSDTIAGMATDPDGEEIEYSKVSGPTWLNVSPDGVLSGIPAIGDLGSNTFTVAADTPLDDPVEATLNIFVADEPAPTIIAVIDGGGPTAGDLAHTMIADLSVGGASIGTMTGSFSSDAAGWQTGDGNYWNNTEWDFDPVAGKTATWTFGNLDVGSEWDVFSTWKEQDNRSDAAPYTIQGGAPILVDQEPVPAADLVLDDGTAAPSSYNFQKIGTGIVNGAGELVVTLSSVADTGTDLGDWVIVDAVAIARQDGGSAPVQVTDLVISGPVAGGMVLSWTSVDGSPYGVQTNVDLVSGIWGTLETGIPGTGGTITVTNTIGPDQTFYRVISE